MLLVGANLRTKRVLLRPPEDNDACDITRFANERSVGANTFIPYPYSFDDAVEFIRRAKNGWKDETSYNMMIVDLRSDQVIGGVGLEIVSKTHKIAETGYWVAKPFRKQGILTEIMPLLLRFAFLELKLHRVTAHVFEGNEASTRLLRRLGFREEGFFHKALKHRGKWRSAHFFAILATEFSPPGAA